MITEFSKKNDLPHLHVLIDRVRFKPSDIVWIQKLWAKHVGTIVNAKKIRNVGAKSYVLKYLQKTFDIKGDVIIQGNAWAYWITNTKFYSMLKGLKPADERMSLEELLPDIYLNLELESVAEDKKYEYVGICSRSLLGEPPPTKLSDEWLLSNGWARNEIWGYWMSPG